MVLLPLTFLLFLGKIWILRPILHLTKTYSHYSLHSEPSFLPPSPTYYTFYLIYPHTQLITHPPHTVMTNYTPNNLSLPFHPIQLLQYWLIYSFSFIHKLLYIYFHFTIIPMLFVPATALWREKMNCPCLDLPGHQHFANHHQHVPRTIPKHQGSTRSYGSQGSTPHQHWGRKPCSPG